jgi:hypothetical protein
MQQRNNMMGQRNGNPPSLKGLGFFLQCNGEAKDLSWNCHAMATLKLKSHKEGQDDMVRKISHQFHSKENDWGFSHFIACDVSSNSLDPFKQKEHLIYLATNRPGKWLAG